MTAVLPAGQAWEISGRGLLTPAQQSVARGAPLGLPGAGGGRGAGNGNFPKEGPAPDFTPALRAPCPEPLSALRALHGPTGETECTFSLPLPGRRVWNPVCQQ